MLMLIVIVWLAWSLDRPWYRRPPRNRYFYGWRYPGMGYRPPMHGLGGWRRPPMGGFGGGFRGAFGGGFGGGRAFGGGHTMGGGAGRGRH